jgi:hypothetical protein
MSRSPRTLQVVAGPVLDGFDRAGDVLLPAPVVHEKRLCGPPLDRWTRGHPFDVQTSWESLGGEDYSGSGRFPSYKYRGDHLPAVGDVIDVVRFLRGRVTRARVTRVHPNSDPQIAAT